MKKLVSLVLALMLCLSCVSALAAEAWTVTCPWAPSGVAAMVNQKAASLSTTYSQDYVLVANAEKGDTATINSWLTKYTEADPQMCFIGEGMFGITAILDPERMNFTYDDFEYVENLYSSIFVASARKELGITSIDALKAYLEEGNQIMVGTNGATGSEAFLAAALIGAMGYGDQFYLIPYESAAEAAQAVARGEVDIAVSHRARFWKRGSRAALTSLRRLTASPSRRARSRALRASASMAIRTSATAASSSPRPALTSRRSRISRRSTRRSSPTRRWSIG